MDVRCTIKCSGGTAVASILNERTGGAESGSFTIRIIGIVSVAGECRAFTCEDLSGGMKWRCAKLRCLCHPHQGTELLWATAIPCSASRWRIRCKEIFSSACIHSFCIETSYKEPTWKRERVESILCELFKMPPAGGTGNCRSSQKFCNLMWVTSVFGVWSSGGSVFACVGVEWKLSELTIPGRRLDEFPSLCIFLSAAKTVLRVQEQQRIGGEVENGRKKKKAIITKGVLNRLEVMRSASGENPD